MTEAISSENIPPVLGRTSGQKQALKLVTLALVIFLCGGAAGWGASLLARRPPRPMGGFGPPPPVDVMVQQLREELLLSDDQAAQMRKIYQEREDALRGIREKMEPELKSQFDKLDEQVKAVLNPAQYQRWSERFRDVRSRMLPMPRPGMPPGAGPLGGPPPNGMFRPPDRPGPGLGGQDDPGTDHPPRPGDGMPPP